MAFKTQIGKCNYAPCEREKDYKGLCRAHYQQMQAGRPLTPLRVYVKKYRDEMGRVCQRCNEYKPWSDYYDKSRSKCKPCLSKTHVEYMKKRRDEA